MNQHKGAVDDCKQDLVEVVNHKESYDDNKKMV